MCVIRLRLDIAYDGTDFRGWAKQPGLRTVQGELEQALATLLRRPDADAVQLTVGGRTDAGVHARGQVAHIEIAADECAALFGKNAALLNSAQLAGEAEISAALAESLTGRLHGVLKRQNASDVVVRQIRPVSTAFDARFSAVFRRYEYRVSGMLQDPLTSRFTAAAKRLPDFQLLQAASAELLGLRDFGAFCKAREGATTIRNLTHFSWRLDGQVRVAHIQADAFCHSMVRALVGACVAVATGRITLARLCEIRDGAKRVSEFSVMPAHGLSLEEIGYPDGAAALAAQAVRARARRDGSEIGCGGDPALDL